MKSITSVAFALLSAAACWPTAESAETSALDYERSEFGRWADDDSDCRNTRHELLAGQSTGQVTWSDDGCRVVRGRWLGVYTGETYSEAGDLHIDHVVPLAYAWRHGADKWSERRREQFANDPVNLLAVEAGANMSKSDRGPLEWMPPDQGYHCQYILRFSRVIRSYDLALNAGEADGLAELRDDVCSDRAG